MDIELTIPDFTCCWDPQLFANYPTYHLYFSLILNKSFSCLFMSFYVGNMSLKLKFGQITFIFLHVNSVNVILSDTIYMCTVKILRL